MPTKALVALEVALDDVQNLLDHHPATKEPKRGRPSTDEAPLRRSCVLLTYAAWEVFAEDSLVEAVEQVVGAAEHPHHLPRALREFVVNDFSKMAAWDLAGEGWRIATVKAVSRLTRGDEQVGTFGLNTASPGNINSQHMRVLGSQPLNQCNWPKKSNPQVKKYLSEFVRVRGAIAHGEKTPTNLHLKEVRDFRDFIKRLAEKLDEQLNVWLETK